MTDLPTRNQAHAYLNHLRDIRGDRCIESCVHPSVAVNIAEHCLEAYVDGRLIDGQALADAWNQWKTVGMTHEEFALIVDGIFMAALTEENNQHDAIQEMMDEAQREAQPDLDAIVESHKTPLRGHWATEENNDE